MNSAVAARIGYRYLTWHGGHRSLRLARRISLAAIAVAVASFLVAVAVSEGFKKELEHVLTGFGPHVILTPDRGGVDPARIDEAFHSRIVGSTESALWRRWRWLVGPLETTGVFFRRYDDLLWQLEESGSRWGVVLRWLHPFRAADWMEDHQLVPTVTIDTIAGALQLAEAGIVQSAPFRMVEGLIASQGEAQGVVLKGLDTVGWSRLFPGAFQTPPVALSAQGERLKVYAGKGLAARLGDGGSQLLVGNRRIPVQIVGTFATGLHEYDGRLLLTDLGSFGRWLPETPTGYDVWLDDPHKGRHLARALEDDLGDHFQILSWDQIYGNLFQALKTEKLVFGILMAILLALCCFQVLGEMLTFSWEMRTSWALWRAIGLKRRSLSLLLYGRAWGLTLIATGLGTALGGVTIFILNRGIRIALPAEIYFLDHLPGRLAGSDSLMVIGLTLLFAGIAVRLGLGQVMDRPVIPILHKGV